MKLIENEKERGILIVDDERAILELETTFLNNKGYNNVYTAYNSLEALSILDTKKEEIYLIIVDIVMPGSMDGIQLVQKLVNDTHFFIGIIFQSGYHAQNFSDYQDLKSNLSDYIDIFHFFQKPFTMNDILNSVNRTLSVIHEKRKTGSNIFFNIILAELNELRVDQRNILAHLNYSKKKGLFSEILVNLFINFLLIIFLGISVILIMRFGPDDLIKWLVK